MKKESKTQESNEFSQLNCYSHIEFKAFQCQRCIAACKIGHLFTNHRLVITPWQTLCILQKPHNKPLDAPAMGIERILINKITALCDNNGDLSFLKVG